jgi:hypothetical protein
MITKMYRTRNGQNAIFNISNIMTVSGRKSADRLSRIVDFLNASDGTLVRLQHPACRNNCLSIPTIPAPEQQGRQA